MEKDKFYQQDTALTFDDVLLVPLKSTVDSRLDTNLKTMVGKFPLRIPIMSAAMDTVTGKDMARKMCKLGGCGIVHRFQSIEERIKCAPNFDEDRGDGLFGVAVGFKDSIDDIVKLSRYYDIVAIDIAHAHSEQTLKFTKELSSVLGEETMIMVGNVCTAQATKELIDAGANIIKVGIGSGAACTTRIVTGFGFPTLSAIIECKQAIEQHAKNRLISLVADGGIRTSGDIAKSIAAGADCVMLGSLLAGTTESPGEVFDTENGKKKIYRGMASSSAQEKWSGGMKKGVAAEGVSAFIPYKGPVEEIINNLTGGLRSALTYADSRDLCEFYENTKFVKVSAISLNESKPHILDNHGTIVEKIH